MSYLYLAPFILLSGILPILLHRHFQALRLTGVLGLTLSCVTGFFVALNDLYTENASTLTFKPCFGLPFSFAVDGLALFFLVPIFLVGAAAALYSYHYLIDLHKKTRIALHYLFLALLILSMAGVILAGSIISFAFFWEAMSVTSAALVLFDYEKEENRRAAFRYFIYTQAGGLFVFAAFGLLFAASGTFELTVPADLSAGLGLTIFLLAMIGFGSKAGLVPLHVWLPHAHPAAPSHVSALMSGVMIKLGIYGILRLFILLAPDPALIGRIFIAAGALSGITGIVYALAQQNLKRLLAYSSVENVGIIFLGLGLGLTGLAEGNTVMAGLGLAGGMLHVWNHALFKSILFMSAGSIQQKHGSLNLDRLGGLLKKMPATGIIVLNASLAICGLPPLNGFISEFLIYSAAFQGLGGRGPDLFFTVLVILSLAVIGGLAIACFTMVFGIGFLGEPRTEPDRQVSEVRGAMLFPLAILTLFCLAIGLLPALFVAPALTVARSFIDFPVSPLFPTLNFCSSIAFGALGFVLLFTTLYLLRLFVYRDKTVTYGPTWGCGFSRPTPRMQYTAASFARSMIRLFTPLTRQEEIRRETGCLFPSGSGYRSRFTDLIELLGERFIGRPLTSFSSRIRLVQHGNIQLYIAYIVLAVIVLLFFQAR